LAAIRQERRVELFCEWANRWYDLNRWNQAAAALGPLKPGWSSNAALYPVPSQQITADPGLVQNPGY